MESLSKVGTKEAHKRGVIPYTDNFKNKNYCGVLKNYKENRGSMF